MNHFSFCFCFHNCHKKGFVLIVVKKNIWMFSLKLVFSITLHKIIAHFYHTWLPGRKIQINIKAKTQIKDFPAARGAIVRTRPYRTQALKKIR